MNADDIQYLISAGFLIALLAAANLAHRGAAWRAAVTVVLVLATTLYTLLAVLYIVTSLQAGGRGTNLVTGLIRLVGAGVATWVLIPAVLRVLTDLRPGSVDLVPAKSPFSEPPMADSTAQIEPEPAARQPEAQRVGLLTTLFGPAAVYGRDRSLVATFTLAVWALVVGYLISLQIGQNLLQQLSSSPPTPVSPGELVLQEAPYFIAAVVGVGLLTRRSLKAALARLGLSWPSPVEALQIPILVVVSVLGFLALGVAFEILIQHATPVTAREAARVSGALFHDIRTVPAVLVLALASGIPEEFFFRGALQPRLGILPAAALFAVIHVQYGFTLLTLQVFLLGIWLGFLRARYGLATSIATHSGYNFIISLVPG